MKRFLALTICLFGLGIAAEANAAEFYLSPSSDEFTTGCESTVDIMMDTEGETSDAANIYVYYDPADIEIVDKDSFTAGDQIQTGNAYSVYVDNIADTGEIRLTGFTVMGGFSGVRTFGSIVFKGREGVTETSMSIYYVAGSTTDSNIAQKDTGLDLLDGVSGGSYTFTTGFCTPDNTAPWVTDASPYNGEENYPLDGDVSFTLNDNQAGVDLDTASITVNGINYSLAGANTFSYSGSPLDYDIVVNPIEDFPDGLEIDISVYACDFDGNCRTTNWSFNEPPPVVEDTTPPWVTNRDPGPNEQNYPLGGNVTFDLEDDMDGVDLGSVVVTVDGIDYTESGPYNFSAVGIPLDYAMTIDPIVDFPDGQAVNINVYACDLNSNCSNTGWIFNEPPPTCEELHNTCLNWYETYECEFEEEPCECEVCEECAECPGDEVEVPDDIVTEETVVEIVEEEIYVPEVTVESEYLLSRSEVIIYALHRRLTLPVDSFGKFYLLPGFDYTVDLPANSLEKEVSSVQWFVNNTRYQLGLQDGVYTATMVAPATSAGYPSHLIVTYTDGTVDRLDYTLVVVPFGSVTDSNNGTTLDGVRVSLYENGALWNADNYLQTNPDSTAGGAYGFMVPSGTYSMVLAKDGYDSEEMSFSVGQIINSSVQLRPLPPTLEEIVAAEPAAAAAMALENVDFVLGGIRDIEWFDGLASWLIPALVALALAQLLLLLLQGLLPLLQYLLTSPLAWFTRYRRKGWGVVYNSISKLPIELAIVRLYKLPEADKRGFYSGRLVQTRVTDKDGRYFFLVNKGTYRIRVKKPGFDFPSAYLEEAKNDGQFLDVYHGQHIVVEEDGQTIAANVPMDPVDDKAAKTPFKIRLLEWLRKLQNVSAVFGVVLSIAVAILIPTVLTIVVAVAQVLIYFLVRYLTRPKKPKNWGIVYDKETKKPLSGTVVRIMDRQSNKVLETAVTGSRGRYSFLVGPNAYYTRYEHGGYQPAEYGPIDFTKNKQPAEVHFDVALEKIKKPNQSE